jgi:predicted nucleic acid-binding protein
VAERHEAVSLQGEDAAAIYRTCHRAGETIRSFNDCFVSAIAIRNDVAVLHRDRDSDIIARHTPLKVAPT